MRLTLWVLLAGACGPAERIEGTEPGDCSDGADNDADGQFDCDDPGCSGAPDCEEADTDVDADMDTDVDTDTDTDVDTDTDTDTDVDTDTNPTGPLERYVYGVANPLAAFEMVSLSGGDLAAGDGVVGILDAGALHLVENATTGDLASAASVVLTLGDGLYEAPFIGDVTGDGIADVGAFDADATYYVVPGPIDGTETLADAWLIDVSATGDIGGALVADFDADGIGDLALWAGSTASQPGGQLAVFGGPISADTSWNTASWWVSGAADPIGGATAGDFDGDGSDDLVIASTQVYVFDGPRSSGMWSTSDAEHMLDGSSPGVGDVDGDGLDDLSTFVLNPAKTVGVYRGPLPSTDLGHGAADARVSLSDGVNFGGTTRLGDIDQDGHGDLIWVQRGFGAGIRVVYGPLAGDYDAVDQPAVLNLGRDYSPNQPILLADIDGQPGPDVVNILSSATGPHPAEVHVFAGGASPPVAPPNLSQQVARWSGTQPASLTLSGGPGEHAELSVVDLDGAGMDNALVVLSNTAAGLTLSWVHDPTPGGAFDGQIVSAGDYADSPAVVGDLTGDGVSDVVFRTTQDLVVLPGPLAQHADLSSAIRFSGPPGGFANPVILGDVTGDAQLDLVVNGLNTGFVVPGPIPSAASIDPGTFTTFDRDADTLVVADVDDDGIDDLAYRVNSDTYVFRGPLSPGVVTVEGAFDHWISDAWLSRAGDLTGDGIPDLLATHEISSTDFERAIRVFASPLPVVQPAWVSLGYVQDDGFGGPFGESYSSGDLDRDGIGDLLVMESAGGGSIEVFYGPILGPRPQSAADASIPFRPTALLALDIPWVVGDVDDDGVDDVVVQYASVETTSGEFEVDVFFGAP
jgi:hypothetical protein